MSREALEGDKLIGRKAIQPQHFIGVRVLQMS